VAIREMEEVFIFCLKEDVADTLKRVQVEGCLHVENFWEVHGVERFYGVERPEAPEELIKVTDVLAGLTRLRDALREIHEELSEEGIKEALASFFRAEEPEKVEFELRPTSEVIESAERFLNQLEEEVGKRLERIDELEGELERLEETRDFLEHVTEDFDVGHLGEGTHVVARLYVVRSDAWNDLVERLEDEPAYAGKVGETEDEDVVAVIALPKGETELEAEIRRMGATEPEAVNEILSELSGSVDSVREELERRIRETREELERLRRELAEYYEERAAEINAWIELLENERELLDEIPKLAMTDRTYLIYGWVPKDEIDRLERAVKEATDGCYALIRERVSDVEEMPVELKNPRPLKPFETLVEMFSPPRPTEVDPTPILAVFFPIYFGFILTDAAYGAILLGLATAIRLTGGRVDEGLKMFSELMIYAGAATIVLGVLTGGYFGNLLGIKPLWVDPMKDPITILLVSLGFGVLHVAIGLILGMYISLRKERDVRAFLGDHLSWFLVLIGGVMLVAGATKLGLHSPVTYAGGGLLGIGVLLVILASLTQGEVMEALMSVLDVIGLMGDVLSYSRLLAGCLSTAGIALVVNLLAKMAKGVGGALGVIMAAIILVIGHVFNMAMNGLGGFVHSLRLHYVEFFSKFYEGGGKPFDPLRIKGKHLKIRA